MKKKKKYNLPLIEIVIGSLVLHLIVLFALGGIVIYQSQYNEDTELIAPDVASEEPEEKEREVKLLKKMKKSKLQNRPKIMVKTIESTEIKTLDIDIPIVPGKVGVGNYGLGGSGFGSEMIDQSINVVKPGSFGGTRKLAHSFVGTIYFFDRIERLRTNGEWFVGEGKKRKSKKLYNYGFNIPEMKFEEGFPGISKQFEWFAIDFVAEVKWPAYMAGGYQFRLSSDDGTILQVDGKDVIDHDGVHAYSSRTGYVQLESGMRTFRLAYFQGPRFDIGLILEFRKQGESEWKIFNLQEILAYQTKAS